MTEVCPNLDHAQAVVVRNGFTSAGKQRYRCVPVLGLPHTFSRHSGIIDLPFIFPENMRLRMYRHDVREIATALMLLGAGASYRQAALGSSHGASSNGQRVASWVQRFGRLVTAAEVKRSWPPIVAVGSLTLRSNKVRDAVMVQLTISAPIDGAPPRLWDCRATVPRVGEWRNFFTRHYGKPAAIVLQRGTQAAAAALSVWSDKPPALIDPRSPDRDIHGCGDLDLTAIDNKRVVEMMRQLHDAHGALQLRLDRRLPHMRDLARLNLILNLMRFDINGQADVNEYTARMVDSFSPR